MSRSDVLVRAVLDLSAARDLAAVMAVVRRAARALTGADGATFVVREGQRCRYADEDAIGPLWKGQSFPMEACISGWAMLNRRTAVVEDVRRDPRIPQAAYEPTFVRSLVMVPIRAADPVGAVGAYWARTKRADAQEVRLLQALADSTALTLENLRAFEEAGRWRALLGEASDAVWTVDPATGLGEVEGLRRWWTALTGRPAECYEDARAWLEDVHPEDRPGMEAAWAEAARKPAPFRAGYRIVAREGAVHHVAAWAVPVPRADRSHELVGLVRDVTREREAEREVQALLEGERQARAAAEAARRTLDQLLERVSDGFVAIDRDWRYTYVNPRAAELLGRRAEELVGAHVWTEFPDAKGGPIQQAFERALLTQQAVFEEVHFAPWDRHYENRIYPSESGLSVFFTDVTEARHNREALRQLSHRLLAAQDEERRRISRDLHDDLGQVLTAVKMSLAALRAGVAPPAFDASVRGAIESVDRSIRQARDLSLRLHPPMLDVLGLGPTLRWYVAERLRDGPLAAHVEVQASLPRADAALESACFRVVQEALTNVQRHAAARNVWVSLREEHAALVLTVRDDGRGFEPARTRARAAAASFAGLAGMEERVALAGGAFALDSRPQGGTTVTASFPCGAPS